MKNLFSLFRFILYPFALVYGGIVWLRNRLYDIGFSSSIEFDVPVIAVGNLSVGGTGKTPHIEYLIRLLQYQFKVATMSRGYKRRTQGFVVADVNTNALKIGDEPMQYHLKFPELVVSVAEERMTGIPYLLQKRPDTEVILLDDAYQHRSVKPGLNILITDYSRPFYRDFILPYGRLREGRSAYKRADIIVVSKCPPGLDGAQASEIKQSIRPLPHQQVYFSTVRYGQPYDLLDGSPEQLSGKSVVLVCCIARPEPLVSHIQGIADQVHTITYPDHHYFSSRNLEEIKSAFDNWDASDKVIVTTEKDAARLHLHLEKLVSWGAKWIVLPIEVAVLLGAQDTFNQQILDYAHKAASERYSLFES